jgi:hypothetical protein
MALFGGEKRQAKNDALQAEVERIDALSLDDLAAETLVKGFGTGAPGANGAIRATDVSGEFIPGDSTSGLDQGELVEINDMVAEGIQRLEHAGLVRVVVSTDGGSTYHTFVTTTRAGRAALESDSVDKALKTRA